MIDQTLKKLCGGSKGVHAFYSSSGRDPDGRGDVTIDALVILPKQLHKQYHDELRQMWLDLLDKTQCTVESDEPLPDHTEGFVVTYTTGIKQGTLRVCCKPGGDRINSHSEGRVTNVPYKDDILNVIIELRETKR
ncbi:MAG: hypothetical protein GX621_11250 [Pirellulaceae bacterium]|nr:hypothetical protein [Pirellulaceae bacterium]